MGMGIDRVSGEAKEAYSIPSAIHGSDRQPIRLLGLGLIAAEPTTKHQMLVLQRISHKPVRAQAQARFRQDVAEGPLSRRVVS
jgi:hypothetical protein